MHRVNIIVLDKQSLSYMLALAIGAFLRVAAPPGRLQVLFRNHGF